MRTLLATCLLACASVRAHPNWKQTTADLVAEGDSLRVTLRIDIPPYLLGQPPQSVEVSTLDDFMFDDREALARRLVEAPGRLGREVELEAGGEPLALGSFNVPTAEAVRAQMRSQPEEDRYPIMMTVEARAAMPAGHGMLRARFPASLGNVLVTFRTSPDRLDMVVVPPGEWSDPVPISGPERGFAATFAGFLRAGFGHVLPDGWDHALFMLAMFLSAPTLRMAFLRSLSFTAGHSLTLGLVWFGALTSPGPWVEPLIAASIVAAGVLAAIGRSSSRWALAGSCAFGLLHGLGFAAAASFSRPGSAEVLGALAGFNAGIESAQLLVISTACLVVLPWNRRPWFETRLRRPLAWLSAMGGLWLLWDRL